GLGFHYLLSLLFTATYFLWYPYISFMKKHCLVAGLLYGIAAWMLMNFVMVPASNAPVTRAPIGMLMWDLTSVVLMMGMPVALLTHACYSRKKI
ncbi:MAG: hypothetical protein WKF70_11390, partial [Chitinophagaceae bacterium]